jgi:hypothetical protein
LFGTLASLENQTSGAYRCILVCHDTPAGFAGNRSTRTINVSFDPPADPSGYKADIGAKFTVGLREYLNDPTELYMFLDADDRLHSDLVRYVETGGAATYLIDKGYVYPGGRWLRAHDGSFDRLCGSVCVSNCKEAAEGFIPSFLGHYNIGDEFRARGLPLRRVPFFAAIKNVGYGENVTETRFLLSESVARTLKKAAMMRPLTPRIRACFALDTNPVEPVERSAGRQPAEASG